jgi:hypothetical protein
MNTTKKVLAVALTALTIGAALAPTGASARGFGGGHGGHGGGMGRMSFGGFGHHGGHYGHGWRRPYYGGYYSTGYYSSDCYRKWVFVPGFGPVLKTFCD